MNWTKFDVATFEESLKDSLQIHLDTRDFHYCCKQEKFEFRSEFSYGNTIDIDWESISKYPDKFYYCSKEVISVIERLYKECEVDSKPKWRLLSLKTELKEFIDWNLKYIRIYKVEDEEDTYIICNSYNYCLRKSILLESKVNKEILSAY